MMDVDKLEGRELDAAVAEAMGCHVEWSATYNEPMCCCDQVDFELPHEQSCSYVNGVLARYSRGHCGEIWILWRWAHEQGIRITIYDEGDSGFSVDARCKPCDDCCRNDGHAYIVVRSLEEIPTAFCRAMLKAMEGLR